MRHFHRRARVDETDDPETLQRVGRLKGLVPHGSRPAWNHGCRWAMADAGRVLAARREMP